MDDKVRIANESRFTIVQTTDIHSMIFPYNFMKDKEENTSMAHVYSYVKKLRDEGKTVLLLDDGDFLQGQPVRRDAKALVLGNGGASQAVQYALARHGISYDLACRPEHAPCAGCGSLRPFAPQRVLPYASLSEDMFRDEIFLIVNTTSLGMHPCVDEAPRIPYEGLGVSHYAFDLVYNPAETLFLRRCREQGANVRNGLDMLYRQADAAWRIWASSSL